MHSRTARSFIVGGSALALAAVVTLGSAPAASAHVAIAESEVSAGSHAVLTFSVPHGCEGSPTTRVAIRIPDGINDVTPTRSSFYTVEKVMEELPDPITDSHGSEITQRVDQVVYEATTPLPADQRDAFELSLQIPEDAAGTTLYFPTVQTCEEGETAWVQLPESGADAHDLDAPAPSVDVIAAGSTAASDAATDAAAASGSESASVVATTPVSGDDQAPLAITALIVGALGLLTGLLALFRKPSKA
ncbi:MAG: YcnI family protein [Microbacterium sp.]